MRFVLLIYLLVIPLLSHGEVYRWVDENGQIHFGSVPPRLQQPYKPGELESTGENDKTSKENNQQKNASEQQKKSDKQEQIAPDKSEDSEISIKKDTANKLVEKYRPKTAEEKRLEAERERERSEKFNALIKRLKTDLGTIKNSDQKDSQSQGDENAKQSVKVDDNKLNNKNIDKIEDEAAEQKPGDNKHEDEEVKQELESVEQAEIQVNEKCGFFKSFVENYEDRVKYECPSEYCSLLTKKLEQYRNKVKQYCGEQGIKEGPVSEKVD